MEKAILGALFNDFVPKLTVETHMLKSANSISNDSTCKGSGIS